MKTLWVLFCVIHWSPSITTQEAHTQFNLSSNNVGYMADENVDGNLLIKSNISQFLRDNLPGGILIVGGKPAQRNEFPWLVDLFINGSACGGSLITLDTVLTAAHCLKGDSGVVDPGAVIVSAGMHNLLEINGTEQRKIAAELIIHEDYNMDTLANDIALIKFDENFTLTGTVRPIALPHRNEDVVGTSNSGTAAGWGSTWEGGDISPVLMKVQVPLVTGQSCNSAMSYSPGQFCAGTTGKDSCQGDSGGPILCNSKLTVVCGIVSYGEGCARPNKPGVYTKVSSYISWISQFVELHQEESTTTMTSDPPTTMSSDPTTPSSSSLTTNPFSYVFLILTTSLIFDGVFQIIFDSKSSSA